MIARIFKDWSGQFFPGFPGLLPIPEVPFRRSSLRPPCLSRRLSPHSWCSYFLILLLCCFLTGCGLFNPGPSSAVVETAVAQKLLQTQELLRSQLAHEITAIQSFEVGRVKVSSKRKVTLGNQPAFEVEGTYTLKGGNLSRIQRQQSRPFDIYLQRGAEQDQWFLLEPNFTGTTNLPAWRAISLP